MLLGKLSQDTEMFVCFVSDEQSYSIVRYRFFEMYWLPFITGC